MITSICQTLIFGQNGNAQAAQLHGWSEPEDGFTWTAGTESGLLIEAPDSQNGFFVELEMNPFVCKPAPSTQTIELVIDGRLIARMVLEHPCITAIFVEPMTAGTISFIIRHPDAASPIPGSRMLAFAFRRVRVLAINEILIRPVAVPAVNEWSRDVRIEDVEPIPGVTAQDLALGFEMLAGNCEFGGMQRRLGVEPLSLFRFAGASASAAINALDSDFEGIGESIEPYVADNSMREWMIRDHRYHLNYHTLISSSKVSVDEIITKEKKKIHFLKRKFLEDLSTPGKVFVCSDVLVTTDEEIMALFLALRRKSRRSLLWVRLAAGAAALAGTVVEMLPGLIVGYIDRFSPPEDGTDISMEGWLTLLAKASLLRQHGDRPVSIVWPRLPEAIDQKDKAQFQKRDSNSGHPSPSDIQNGMSPLGEMPTGLEKSLDAANIYHQMADLLIRLDRNDEALESAQKAVELDPVNFIFRILLSDLLARIGRSEEALMNARAAANLAPDSAHALGHLAHITQLTGALEPAAIMFRKAIDMDPNNDHLRTQLSFLLDRQKLVQSN